MPTIAHISDLHLQSGNAARQSQVEPILQKINEMKPDLVVISGDVTDDGWDSIEELKWAKAWLDERISGEWFAVPGNHDVGNFVTLPEGQINTERITAWNKAFENKQSHCFATQVANWHICGLDSMVLGSGLGAELVQWERWQGPLKNVDWADQYLAVFIHSPLFINQTQEPVNPDASYWLGSAEARKTFWTDINTPGLNLLASGHVHQTRLTEVDGVKVAWAPPASGTWVHAPGLPNPPMPKQTGFFLHHLHDDGRVDSELIDCAPMLKLYEHKP